MYVRLSGSPRPRTRGSLCNGFGGRSGSLTTSVAVSVSMSPHASVVSSGLCGSSILALQVSRRPLLLLCLLLLKLKQHLEC